MERETSSSKIPRRRRSWTWTYKICKRSGRTFRRINGRLIKELPERPNMNFYTTQLKIIYWKKEKKIQPKKLLINSIYSREILFLAVLMPRSSNSCRILPQRSIAIQHTIRSVSIIVILKLPLLITFFFFYYYILLLLFLFTLLFLLLHFFFLLFYFIKSRAFFVVTSRKRYHVALKNRVG